MARPRVKLDSAGVVALLRDPGVRADLQTRGQRVLAAQQASCPRESGALAASLQVRIKVTDRIVVQVGSGLDYALSVTSVTGFMQRSLDAAR
jgi:hypothetical protein